LCENWEFSGFTEDWSIVDELFETGRALQAAANKACRVSGIGSLEADG